MWPILFRHMDLICKFLEIKDETNFKQVYITERSLEGQKSLTNVCKSYKIEKKKYSGSDAIRWMNRIRSASCALKRTSTIFRLVVARPISLPIRPPATVSIKKGIPPQAGHQI